MGFPNYFSKLPNNRYTFTVNKAGKPEFFNIKDFFHLMRVREDILDDKVLYTQYYIDSGKRPEQVSYELYGDEQYYWVILQINEIVDPHNEWPLSRVEMNEYVLRKYGSWEKADSTHHWETEETYDRDGNLILPSGLIVDESFEYFYWDDPENQTVRKKVLLNEVTNSEYEERLNEKKSVIDVLDKKYIYDYVREVRKYFKSLTSQESSVNISDYF